MLAKELEPSALLETREVQPVEIVIPRSERYRYPAIAFRLGQLLTTLLWLWLRRRFNQRAVGIRTRQALEELGYLWIKVGQLLSLRPDVLGADFCDELSRLHSRAQGFPSEIATDHIQKQLNAKISDIFEEFDEVPFAAASIAQVHTARLRRNHCQVVVKVRRPGADTIFNGDMQFVRRLIWVVNVFGFLSFVRWDEALWELEQIMKEEVDYRYELENIRRMSRTLKHHGIYVPEVFAKYCTKSVLVLERVQGVLVTDFIKVHSQDRERLKHWCKENNIRPKRVGNRLNYSFLRQLFEDELFHGDLHPGNILLLRNSQVCLIDFGSIGTPDRDLWQRYLYMMKAIATRDYHRAVDIMISLCPEIPYVNIDRISQRMVRELRSWEKRTSMKSLDYHEKSMTRGISDVISIMARSKLIATWGFLRIDRTWGTLDATLSYMTPHVDYPKLFRRYFTDREKRVVDKTYNVRSLRKVLVEIPEKLGEWALFVEPELRKAARAYSSFTSKAWQALGSLLNVCIFIALCCAVLLPLAYYHQQHGWFPDPNEERIIDDILQLIVPRRAGGYSDRFWVFAIGGDFTIAFTLWRLRRRVLAEEVNIPSRIKR